ncbi:MAG TPA: hypothetical protein VIJ14_01205 [Rhabdochlamydiaceae bacterium]
MAIQLVNSFLGLFRKCSGETSGIELTDLSRPKDWNSLPREILENILDLVGDPARTALVNRNFQEQSQHSYQVLLEQSADYPCLAELIPSERQPAQKVQAIYLFIRGEARSCGIDPLVIEPNLLPLAPQRLARIRELTLPRLQDKFHVYRAVFQRINPQFGQTFDQMTLQGVIELSEKSLGSRAELYSSRPTQLDLGSRHLSYLPAHIGCLNALDDLNLHHNNLKALPSEMKFLIKLRTLALNGNPLSPENVKEVCLTLPRLKTVVVDNEQPDLLEMFQTHFPNLQLRVVNILRIEEAI